MLLNGWKEIATYLKCGVRTAQRWQRELHLPIIRVRDGKRGPVMAESHNLDEWLKHRSESVTNETVQRRTSAADVNSNFLWVELETGRQFARLAKTSKNASTIARRRQAARLAYDTLQRYLSRKVYLSQFELKDFHDKLQEFRQELEQLGEVFDT